MKGRTQSDADASSGLVQSRWLGCVLFVCIAVLSLTSCSGRGANPTTPSPSTVNVAGTWVGTITYMSGTISGQENFSMLLVQTEGSTTVTGSYQADRFSGGISGQTTANSFSARFDFTPNTPEISCAGTFDSSGPAGGTTMTLTSATVTASAPCSNPPVNLTITVQRQ